MKQMNTVKNPAVLLFINITLLKKKYDSKKSCDRVFLRLIHSHRQHWKKSLNKMRDATKLTITVSD